MKSLIPFLLLTVNCLSFAAVTGNITESRGKDWHKASFLRWIEKENALLTSESLNLATQYCLRDTQKFLDSKAFDELALPLTVEIEKSFEKAKETEPVAFGLLKLSELLSQIKAMKIRQFSSPENYISQCQKLMKEEFAPRKQALYALFEGRMNPQISTSAPAGIKEKIIALKKRGVRIAPLTDEGLTAQVCELEGYYSQSTDPKLWKLFSITRLMANVLPSEANNADFIDTLNEAPKVRELIGKLDRYSAVAGRSNGLSVGMTDEERRLSQKLTPVRMTGSALGSNSTSLMSFFTTAWRERLQDHVLQTNYPTKPFQLISLNKVLNALEATAQEITSQKDERQFSQTEEGMNVVWSSLSDSVTTAETPQKQYKETAALAWLALNAETNIRQNEKIGGVTATAVVEVAPTRHLLADEVGYQGIEKEIDAALNNYAIVGSLPKDNCAVHIKTLANEAAEASKNKTGVVTVREETVAFFGQAQYRDVFKFQPVIAEIGAEVLNDKEGLEGQNDFRLHLATGAWREVPLKFSGKSYLVGTPSAFVLHLPETTATNAWGRKVAKYDGE